MYVIHSSLLLLIDAGVKSLPINSRQIAKKNWKLCTYDDLAFQVNKSKNYLKSRDNDGFTYWSAAEQTYIICYNSEKSDSQINWTVMHEIAHIVLGHISPNTPVLPNDNIGFLELQAQEFALHVLCPIVIWDSCNITDIDQLAELCNIPKKEIKNVQSNMLPVKCGNASLKLLEKYVKKQFAMFLCNYQKYDCEFALAF